MREPTPPDMCTVPAAEPPDEDPPEEEPAELPPDEEPPEEGLELLPPEVVRLELAGAFFTSSNRTVGGKAILSLEGLYRLFGNLAKIAGNIGRI